MIFPRKINPMAIPRPVKIPRMTIGARQQRNLLGLSDDGARHVDGVDDPPQIESVRHVVAVRIANGAAQRDHVEDRDLVGVVDLGDGVDERHEA